jgi:hypothetical protein
VTVDAVDESVGGQRQPVYVTWDMFRIFCLSISHLSLDYHRCELGNKMFPCKFEIRFSAIRYMYICLNLPILHIMTVLFQNLEMLDCVCVYC